MKNCYFSIRMIVVVVALLLAVPSMMAYTFAEGGIFYDIDNNVAWVTYKDQNYNSYSGQVTIPSSVTHGGITYTVYGIGTMAFYRSELTSVTLPNTLVKINDAAFMNCANLKGITIPNSVTSIGESAFQDCSSLKDVRIGNEVKRIETYTFYQCHELETLTLGNRIRDIGYSAFRSCYKLKSLIIPNSVETIGEEAFEYCHALTSVVIGNGVTTICDHAFHECENMSSVVIGNHVTSIGNYAFYSCSSLKTVNIPNSVEAIGYCAFSQCQGLTHLNIGSGVKTIGHGAFGAAWQLVSITSQAVTPPTFENDDSWVMFNNNVYNQATLYVPASSISKYRNAEIWNDFVNIKAIVEQIAGDVNGDGEVNIADVNALINIILGGIGNNEAADVNGDHEVNIADVNALIDIILNPVVAEDHEWVDLGLPSGTLWATCNVGANAPEGYGDYFAWGETEPKEIYSWETYKWSYGINDKLTKYCTNSFYGTVDNKTELELADDAAYVNWGASWRIPTYEQLKELSTKCLWVWTTHNGVNGYQVTGPNGKTMFLPAAGYGEDSSLCYADWRGYYWSRELYYESSYYANYLYFISGRVSVDWSERCYGLSVRAVRASQN